jgi:hypothetical protein
MTVCPPDCAPGASPPSASATVAAAKKEAVRGIFILGPSWEGLGG